MYHKLLNKPKLLSEFVGICSKTNYFEATASNSHLENIQFKPFARILQRNIEREALLKSSDGDDTLKTFSETDFEGDERGFSVPHKYSTIRKRHRWTKSTPFGIVDLQKLSGESAWSSAVPNEEDISIALPANSTKISASYFVTEQQSFEHFYRIQQQRKIWWMKYAANPGRFRVTELKKSGMTQSVSLVAKYPFGNLAIEHIDLVSTSDEFPESRIPLPPRIIRTRSFLEVATIETVLDAIDDGDYGEMCLHRKIAPYQCAVFCLSDDASCSKDFSDLAKYLSMMLEKHGVSILNADERIVPSQSLLNDGFLEMDAIGVPYELILEPSTLENGMLKLRNRDTTICETIHLSSLPHYLLKIFQ